MRAATDLDRRPVLPFRNLVSRNTLFQIETERQSASSRSNVEPHFVIWIDERLQRNYHLGLDCPRPQRVAQRQTCGGLANSRVQPQVQPSLADFLQRCYAKRAT